MAATTVLIRQGVYCHENGAAVSVNLLLYLAEHSPHLITQIYGDGQLPIRLPSAVVLDYHSRYFPDCSLCDIPMHMSRSFPQSHSLLSSILDFTVVWTRK